jgi:plasmid stability protein
MPSVSIKNVPEGLLSRLRERAARHHRSLQGELMALLSAALDAPQALAAPPGADSQPNARRSGSRRIEDIAAEHRNRRKKPLGDAPRAVDIIRADRNAR